MRTFRSAIAIAGGLLPLLWAGPGLSQIEALPQLPPPQLLPPTEIPSPPGLPALSDPSPVELASCVPRYGNTGCAARLYARLLCDVAGQAPMPDGLQQQLDGQYERAAINFSGITVEQVESAAVRYYVPMLCPAKAKQIQALFAPMAEPDS